MERVQKRPPSIREVRAAMASGGVFQHHKLAFEQRIEFGTVHVDLVRRMTHQHEGCKFVWT